MKVYEISTVQAVEFADALLQFGKVGAKLEVAYKGQLLRARVAVEDDAEVPSLRCIRLAAGQPVEEKKNTFQTTLVDEKLTREQLEVMSLGEVRKATGISKGGKEEVIKQYLGE